MDFDNPGALWLLPALLVLFAALGWWGWQTKQGILRAFSLDGGKSQRKQTEKYLVGSTVGALLIVAAALPKVAMFSFTPPEKAGEIAMLVDVSGSMAAQKDPQSPSRLVRVQVMLEDILDRLPDLGQPKVSLHGYTNIARSHVPLVGREDYGYLRESIRKVLGINSTPGQGSVLGQSILDVLPKFSAAGTIKVILMLGDGEAYLGSTRGLRDEEKALLEQAIQKAKDAGVTIITIGVGEREGARIPVFNAKGEFTGEYVQFQGSDYVSRLEDEQLRELAEQTGGRYFTESNWRELIPFLGDKLSSADSVSTGKEVKVYQSLAPWFLVAAVPFWMWLIRRHLLD